MFFLEAFSRFSLYLFCSRLHLVPSAAKKYAVAIGAKKIVCKNKLPLQKRGILHVISNISLREEESACAEFIEVNQS